MEVCWAPVSARFALSFFWFRASRSDVEGLDDVLVTSSYAGPGCVLRPIPRKKLPTTGELRMPLEKGVSTVGSE